MAGPTSSRVSSNNPAVVKFRNLQIAESLELPFFVLRYTRTGTPRTFGGRDEFQEFFRRHKDGAPVKFQDVVPVLS